MRIFRIAAIAVMLGGTAAAAAPGAAGVAPDEVPARPATDGPGLSRSFAAVAHAIGAAVVRVEVPGQAGQTAGHTTASGIVLDTRGNIVTSRHAFDAAQSGAPVAVTLPDGRRFSAELVGSDPASDVAVVRLVDAPGDLSAARFGDSDEAEVGEWVLAVGSAWGLDQTFTAGIISGRSAFLLTDAKVNPGDAGGPLVDLDGQVLGLTTLISAGPGGGFGYAIPINRVRRVAQDIVEDGHADHPYIGIGVKQLDQLPAAARTQMGAIPSEGGAVVSQVGQGTPAARAGLRPGDVITAIDAREVPAPAELVTIIERQPVGAHIAVSFVRGGQPHKVVVSVEDLPVPATMRAGQ